MLLRSATCNCARYIGPLRPQSSTPQTSKCNLVAVAAMGRYRNCGRNCCRYRCYFVLCLLRCRSPDQQCKVEKEGRCMTSRWPTRAPMPWYISHSSPERPARNEAFMLLGSIYIVMSTCPTTGAFCWVFVQMHASISNYSHKIYGQSFRYDSVAAPSISSCMDLSLHDSCWGNQQRMIKCMTV